MITVGVDPDTHTLAVAILSGPKLLWWHVSDVKRSLRDDDAVVAVARDLAEVRVRPIMSPGKIVIEQMRVYPETDLGTAGINGLMRVASTGGVALSWLLQQFPLADYAMPTAPEWKGQVSKVAHHRQILAKVDDGSRTELQSIPARLRGHLLDAVGMALWAQSERGARREARKDILAAARKRARRARG